MTKRLPLFWKEILAKKLLHKQGRGDQERLRSTGIIAGTILLNNTSINDVIALIEELIK